MTIYYHPIHHMNLLQLPPELFASLNGCTIASLRAVSRAHKEHIDSLTGTNGNRRNNKLRRADPEKRCQADYLAAIDQGLQWVLALPVPKSGKICRSMSVSTSTPNMHDWVSFSAGTDQNIRRRNLQRVRAFNPRCTQVWVTQWIPRHEEQTIYPQAVILPPPENYTSYPYTQANLSRSGRIVRFLHDTNHNSPDFSYTSPLLPPLNRRNWIP